VKFFTFLIRKDREEQRLAYHAVARDDIIVLVKLDFQFARPLKALGPKWISGLINSSINH